MTRILEPDATLVREILPQLAQIETELAMGEILMVQPHDDEHCRHGRIKVDGYNLLQINEALRYLVQEHLVDNGGVPHPGLGIHFARLTRAGRNLLGRAGGSLR